MPVSYGYIKRTESTDGEGVDIFLGDNPESDTIWVVDQQHADTKVYDEPKVMAFFANRAEAVKAYKRAFSDGKGWARIKSITEMSVAKLKEALGSMWQKKPVYKGKPGERGGIELPTAADLKRAKDALTAKIKALAPELSKAKGGPLKKLANQYTIVARKLLSEPFHEAIGYRFDALGNLPWKREYRIERYLTFGKILRVDNTIKKVYRALRDASPEQAKEIYAYLTTRGARPNKIDEKFRAHAVEAKDLIGKVGRALVEREMISKESYDKYAGEYLPRVYLKHLLGDSAMSALGAGKLPDLSYTKQRNENLTEEERMLILGQITDPAFLASRAVGIPRRDIAILDFLSKIAANQDWTLPSSLVKWNGKTVSAVWLKGESKRVAEMSTYIDDPVRAEQMRDMARRMAAVADAALDNQKRIPEDYKQVPDTARYGMLRGMWIRKEIYDDLVGGARLLPRDRTWVESLLGFGGVGEKLTQYWKTLKVPLNPPSVARNVMSNAIMTQMFGGVPLHLVPSRVTQAVREMARGGPHWSIAEKYGIRDTNFASAELTSMHEELRDLQAREGGQMAKVRYMAELMAKRAGDYYGNIEAIFKTAIIIDAMQRQNMSEENAVLLAQDAIFDYGLAPRWVRALRSSPIGIPFLSFAYFSTGQLAKTAVEKPWRFAPYYAFLAGLEEIIMYDYDVDDEDFEALMLALPRWLHETGSAYLLPVKDKNGRWQAMDFGYLFPWGLQTELATRMADGDVLGAAEKVGIFGSPLADLGIALTTKTDPFTDQPIYLESDPPKKKMAAVLNYLWGMAAPTWITDKGAAGHLYNLLFGTGQTRTGEPAPTALQTAGRFVGLNVYSIDPDKSRASNLRYMNFEIEEQERQRNRIARDRSLSPDQRRRAVKAANDHIKVLRHRLQEYNKTSKVHPNLKATPPKQ